MTYAATPLRMEEHGAPLARLWVENMSDRRIATAVPARMRWLYEDGPDGPATTVLARVEESGEIVGCGSFLPRPTWVAGRRVRAAVLCDFAVARAHRVAGAALVIQRALVEAARAAGVELLYGYPNEKSLAVFKRIGYRVVGETTSWLKPLRSEYKLRDVLRWTWAAPALAIPIDAGIAGLDRLRAWRFRPRVRGEHLAHPDARIDGLWERSRGRHGVIAEKSSAYLRWRYGCFTTGDHQTFAVSRRGDERLLGYAVYAVEDGKAFVRDLLAGDVEHGAELLLLALADHLRRERVDSVYLSYLGDAAFGERLRALGFVRRPGRRTLVLHPGGVPEPLRACAFDPASWFMLDGELDI